MASPPEAATSPPPDWDKVPFDVGCARCGHDVRGQSEPRCSACGLEFDWSDAVPIEKLTCGHCGYHLYGLRDSRCPECGTRFTWEEALLRFRAGEKWLFEYRWRDAPIRSFVRTWLRALRPGRFWRSIDIHDPPQTGPLRFVVLLGLVLIALELALLTGIEAWLWNVQWQRTASGWVRGAPRIADLPLNLLKSATDFQTYLVFRALVPWCFVSFLSLLLFPQSMRMARVRIVHVARVWAYSLLPAFPLVLAGVFTFSVVSVLLGAWYRQQTDAICAGIVITYAIWSIRCGFRFYLRMPHAMAVAVASQVVAVLASWYVEASVASNLSHTFLYKLFDFIGFF